MGRDVCCRYARGNSDRATYTQFSRDDPPYRHYLRERIVLGTVQGAFRHGRRKRSIRFNMEGGPAARRLHSYFDDSGHVNGSHSVCRGTGEGAACNARQKRRRAPIEKKTRPMLGTALALGSAALYGLILFFLDLVEIAPYHLLFSKC